MATNFKPPPMAQAQVSLTMYEDDLSQLDAMVERAKFAGGKYASRNRLIRIACLKLEEMTPEQIVAELAKLPITRR